LLVSLLLTLKYGYESTVSWNNFLFFYENLHKGKSEIKSYVDLNNTSKFGTTGRDRETEFGRR